MQHMKGAKSINYDGRRT